MTRFDGQIMDAGSTCHHLRQAIVLAKVFSATHQHAPAEPCEPESREFRPEDEQRDEPGAQPGTEVHLCRRRRVQRRADDDVGHDDDQRVFLDVERARVEVDAVPKGKAEDFEREEVCEEFAEWVDE